VSLWTKSHSIVTEPSHMRAPLPGIVDREGGGMLFPTLGGGLPEMRGGAAG